MTAAGVVDEDGGGVVKQRLSALVFPLATVVIAFVIGGLVVILVGANPFTVYKQLAVGAGLDWPFQYLPGHPVHVDPVCAVPVSSDTHCQPVTVVVEPSDIVAVISVESTDVM